MKLAFNLVFSFFYKYKSNFSANFLEKKNWLLFASLGYQTKNYIENFSAIFGEHFSGQKKEREQITLSALTPKGIFRRIFPY